MEASEKPQLPLDAGHSGDGIVRALGDRLVIERLEVEDQRAARVVRDRAEGKQSTPAETVRDAIEIGARVLERETTAANVDYVKRELDEGLGHLSKELSRTLEAGDAQLVERIASAFGADRADSVQHQIRDIVTASSETQRLELTRLLSAEDGSNPLVAVQARMGKAILESDERHRQEMARLRESNATESRAMQRQVAELRERVARLLDRQESDQLLAEAEEAGTRKGVTFEQRVHAAIDRIASARGDVSSHTGAEAAEGGGKKGDTLVELGACEGPASGRILFEAKDKKLSKNEAWAELNAGMEARAASFAVLVVAGEERIPSGREQLHEYEGNKMIVAVDRSEPGSIALETAYRLAAARVAMARDRELRVDAGAVRDTAEDAISTLRQAQAIRSNLTGIKTSSDKARTGLDAMVESIRAKLERIETLIAAADTADEETG
jgi:Uncharacterized protein conserved in bacteria (DUF2130)